MARTRLVDVMALTGCASAGFLIGTLLVGMAHVSLDAQQAGTPQQAQNTGAQNLRVFNSDAAIVLNFVKPEKTADFEQVVAKLKEALAKSDKGGRKDQAAGWKIFRAVEPAANGAALYVFAIDPAVHDADYTVSTILAEAFPGDVQELYKKYADAYVSGQNFVNLKLVADLGE